MKTLLFTVPLLRTVIPLDSLNPSKLADRKSRTNAVTTQQSAGVRLTTLLHLARIVTPMEAVLPNKVKTSLKAPAPVIAEPTSLPPAPRRKAGRRPKPSSTRARRASPRRKRK